MTLLLRFSAFVDRLNTVIGKAVSWLILAAVLVSAANAATRKLFSLSSNAWLELQWYLFSAVFLLAAGYTLLRGEHVRVDILYTRLPRRAQLWIDLLGTLFFLLPFCAITIMLSWPVVVAKFTSGESSGNAGGLILWPVWALIPAGFLLLSLQGLSQLVKTVAILAGRLPDVVAPENADAAER